MLRNLLDSGLEEKLERISVGFSYDSANGTRTKDAKFKSGETKSDKSFKLQFLGRIKPKRFMPTGNDLNHMIGRMAHLELLDNTDFIQMFQCLYDWHL